MDGGTSGLQLQVLPPMAVMKPADKLPDETTAQKSASAFVQEVDYADVLNSILE